MVSPARWVGLFLGISWSLLFPSEILASVVINEISTQTTSDWVELYNRGEVSVNIDGWQIWDLTSKGEEQRSAIIQGIEIAAKGLYAVEVSNRLNKNGDTVFLKNQTGEVDKYTYANQSGDNNCFGRKVDGESWQLITPCSKGESNNSAAMIEISSSPSPSASSYSSPSPSPIPDVDNIFLNEIMVCPNTGENEWIELYNANDQSVELVGWQLRDSDDGHRQDLNLTLQPRSLTKINNNFSLNNDGDSARLFAQDNLKDSMSYSICEKGYSWSKVAGSWCQTEPSPNQNNKSCVEFDDSNSDSQAEESSPLPESTAEPQVLESSTGDSAATKKFSSSGLDDQVPEATFTGEILGATASSQPSSTPETISEEKSQRKWLIPAGLMGVGLIFLGVAAFPLLKPKLLLWLKGLKA